MPEKFSITFFPSLISSNQIKLLKKDLCDICRIWININSYKSLMTCNISDNIFMPLFSQKRICDKFSFAISSGLMILISQALMTWYTVFNQLENGCKNAKCVYGNTQIPINVNEYFTIYHFKIYHLSKRK